MGKIISKEILNAHGITGTLKSLGKGRVSVTLTFPKDQVRENLFIGDNSDDDFGLHATIHDRMIDSGYFETDEVEIDESKAGYISYIWEYWPDYEDDVERVSDALKGDLQEVFHGQRDQA